MNGLSLRRGFAGPAWLVSVLFALFFAVTMAEARAPSTVSVTTASGVHRFTVEWATNEAEREHGLMGRRQMAADHGMIFDFGTEQTVIFWMKDTPLPLDMIFIAGDGTVRRVAANATPFSLDMIPSEYPVRYVLEVNGGIARKLGILPGAKVDVGKP